MFFVYVYSHYNYVVTSNIKYGIAPVSLSIYKYVKHTEG